MEFHCENGLIKSSIKMDKRFAHRDSLLAAIYARLSDAAGPCCVLKRGALRPDAVCAVSAHERAWRCKFFVT